MPMVIQGPAPELAPPARCFWRVTTLAEWRSRTDDDRALEDAVMTDALALMRFLADPAAFRAKLEALEAQRATMEALVRRHQPQLDALRDLEASSAALAERERRLAMQQQALDAERAVLDSRRARLEAALQG